MNNNFAIIQNLLDKHESDRIQFFPTYNRNSVCRCIAAFANNYGGDILIGVDEDRQVIGVESAEETIQTIMDVAKAVLIPEVALFTDIFAKGNQHVILITVWEGSKKPYLVDGNIYVMRGGNIKIATPRELGNILTQRVNFDRSWEREIVVGSSVDDIDMAEVQRLIDKTKYKCESPIDYLQQQGLIRAGSVTNAGIVLFGNKPDKYLPQIRVRLNVFAGDSEMIQSKVYSQNMFCMIRLIIEDLDNIYGKHIIIDRLYRKETKSYPDVALREALLNSLIHREIASNDCFVTISVYPTHTDVTNKGGLMNGITVSSLKKEHMSVLRNPDIAYFAYLNELIEMAGSGTLRMISDCTKNSFPVPKWTVSVNSVKVTFVGVKSKTDKPIMFKSDDFLANYTSEKKDEVRNVVNFMKKNGGKAKTKDIEAIVQKSLPSIRRLTKLMVSEGIIVYIGSTREGSYYLTDNEEVK